jgi:hypothetical protein
MESKNWSKVSVHLRQACREWIRDGSKKAWLSTSRKPRHVAVDEKAEEALLQLFHDLNDEYKLFKDLGSALLILKPFLSNKAYANLVNTVARSAFGVSDLYFKYYVQSEESVNQFPDMNSFVKWLNWVRKLGAVKI